MEAKSIRQSRRRVHFLSVTWGAGFCCSPAQAVFSKGLSLHVTITLQKCPSLPPSSLVRGLFASWLCRLERANMVWSNTWGLGQIRGWAASSDVEKYDSGLDIRQARG